MTTTKTYLPITASFTWRAPAKYFFADERVPSLSQDEIIERIKDDAEKILKESPSIEGFSKAYNVSAAEFIVDGELIQPFPFNEDIKGSAMIEITVSVEGEIEANNGPGAMKSWGGSEIFDEIEEYSDLNGHPERFKIEVSWI